MQCIGYPKMAKVKYTYNTATLVTTACVCTNVKAKHKKHSETERGNSIVTGVMKWRLYILISLRNLMIFFHFKSHIGGFATLFKYLQEIMR